MTKSKKKKKKNKTNDVETLCYRWHWTYSLRYDEIIHHSEIMANEQVAPMSLRKKEKNSCVCYETERNNLSVHAV